MKRALVSGDKYGALTAVSYVEGTGGMTWIFRCDCGHEKPIRKYGPLDGRVKSCGCLNNKRAARGESAPRHGGTGTRLHNIWRDAIKRCTSHHIHNAHRYSLRGITICHEWQSDFVAFRDWAMSNGYADDLTLDRIDNDGNYEPGNCRWADRQEQARNRCSSRYLTHMGRVQTAAAWAAETGICQSTITTRLNRGWAVDRALTESTSYPK